MDSKNLRQNLKTTVSDGAAETVGTSSIQHEDVALKTAFQYFSEELLPYFGITEKVAEIASSDERRYGVIDLMPADGRGDANERPCGGSVPDYAGSNVSWQGGIEPD